MSTAKLWHRVTLILVVACVGGLWPMYGAQASAAGEPAVAAASTPWSVRVVQTTADLSQRLKRLADAQFTTKPVHGLSVIHVSAGTRYQQIKGVGAAMTDTSAWLIETKLSPSRRTSVMKALFGTGGIRLGWTVVPIGASDFTATGVPYTYDDRPAGQTDPQLAHFSIAHDAAYILPALRQMRALNPQTQVFAVPWTAPAWMKANDALGNSGHRGSLLPWAYGPFANYIVRFLQAYRAQGVPVADVAPENEPDAPPPYPGMDFPATAEAQWIATDLAPALRSAHLHPHIYGGDTGWPNLTYAQALASSQARSALTGIAWHCYGTVPGNMVTVHRAAPALDQVVTECSPGLTPLSISDVLIASVRDGASAVALWNLALNQVGGPVQPPNVGCRGCHGVITINQQTGSVSYGSVYYQLGQWSRFVQPGAWRINSEHFVSYSHGGATAGLDDVALLNPDGSRVLFAYNTAPTPIRFAVSWAARAFTYTLPSRATVTFIWK